MIDLTTRMLHLRRIPIGALVSAPVLRLVAAQLRERTFAAGEFLMRQGERVDGMQMLTEGTLALRRDGGVFGQLEAPQTLGMLGVMARQRASYDAIARTEVRSFELEGDALLELYESHFDLLSVTLGYFAARLCADVQALPASELELAAAEPIALPARPLAPVDRILLLRAVPGLAEASIPALASMARRLDEVHLPAGTTLWRAGDGAEQILLLLRGRVRCETADGRVFHLGAGAAVGSLEAIADQPRWYRAVAATDVIALRGHADRLIDLFEHENRTAMDVVTTLARAQIALVERRAALGQQPLDVRLGHTRVGALPRVTRPRRPRVRASPGARWEPHDLAEHAGEMAAVGSASVSREPASDARPVMNPPPLRSR